MALDRPPIAGEIRATLAVAAPLAAANLAQMAMQVTNAVMVGHLGAVPLAAAGLGNALNATLLMTSQGLLTAVAPLAAHSIGAGDYPAAGRVAGGGLIVATAVAAPMMATLMVVPPLLSGLGYEPGLVAEIGRFLSAISWSIPGVAGNDAVLFVDQHRVGEAKFADRGGDLRDLLVAVRARVSGEGDRRRAPAPNNRLG